MNDVESKTILLVEDEAIISIVISKTLKRFGYNVISVNSGEKALISVSSGKDIDLILMDIDLGEGIDGTEAARQILAIRNIPIVFHTSHSEREMVERVRGITRYGYVIKSSGDFVLQSSIEMAFELVAEQKKVKASEEHFFGMFEKAPLGYQSLDEEGRFLEVNQTWLETLGYSRDEVLGKWFGDFIAPDFVDAFRERFPMFKASGMIHSEFQMVHKNGEKRFIAFEGRVGYKEDGSFQQTHCILSDITERKIAEEELRHTRALLQAAMDQSPAGIAIADAPGGKLRYVNDAGLLIRGGDRQTIVDGVGIDRYVESWKILDFDGRPLETDEVPLARAVLYGETCSREFIVRRSSEDDRIVLANASPIMDENGRVEAGIVVFTDITERKQSEKEIKSKNDELSALNEELNATIEEMEAANEELSAAMEEMEAGNEELIAANEMIIARELELEKNEQKFRQMFTQHHAVMLLIEPDSGCIIDANSSASDFYGYGLDQFRKMKIGEINALSPEEIEHEMQIAKADGRNYFVFPHRLANSEIRTVEVYSSPVLINGKTLLFSIIHDITRRIEAEEKLRRSEEQFRSLAESSIDYIMVYDKEKRHIYANKATLEVTGKTWEEYIGKTHRDLGDDLALCELWEENIQKVFDTGEPRGEVFEWEGEGGKITLDWRVTPIFSKDGKVSNVLGVSRDISELKHAELDFRNSQGNLKRIIENSSELICELDSEGRYTFVSTRYVDILGYTPDELMGTVFSGKMHPDDLAGALSEYDKHKPEGGMFTGEWRFLHKNGHYHNFECRGSIYKDSAGLSRTVIISHDITETRQIEDAQLFLIVSGSPLSGGDFFQSLARYLAESLGMDYVCIDRLVGSGLAAQTVAVYFDGNFEDNVEYTLKDTPCGDVVGKAICTFEQNVCGLFPDDIVLQDMNAESYAGVTLWSSTGRPIGLIAVIGRKKMENPHIAESILKMVAIRAAGELERRDAEEKIKNLLREKEILLKEVHHRIKNNMNTINGLLSLQAETLEDPAAVDALKDAQSRVQSMMVLYDKLYRSDDFNEVALKEYLPALVTEIAGNFSNSKTVKIETQIDDLILEAKILVPLGIIINELITNSMKYAFTGRESGLITVSAALDGKRAVITIEDNGIGIPESVDLKNSTGFGMQLVEMLTEQIGGSIRIERGEGTRFVLGFDIQ